jgi:Fe-S cluster assembly protein SufB
MTNTIDDLDLGKYKLGWNDEVDYVFTPKRGLSREIVEEMSWMKGEPDWMLKFRLRALEVFHKKPMPNWGGDMSQIFFDDIYYYVKPMEGQVDSWEALPEAVRKTYEKLGIPEAEQKYLAGVTAQYESEVVFHRNREDLEAKGIIFTDMDTALREYPAEQCGVVRRIFHLRATGCGGRHAAAGLLPHQQREHGAVRTYAYHCR